MHTTVFTYTHTYTDFSISYCTNHEIMKPQPQHGVRCAVCGRDSALGSKIIILPQNVYDGAMNLMPSTSEWLVGAGRHTTPKAPVQTANAPGRTRPRGPGPRPHVAPRTVSPILKGQTHAVDLT